MAKMTRAQKLAMYARVAVRKAHADGHTGTQITWLSLQELAQRWEMWGISSAELKRAALDCQQEMAIQGLSYMVNLRDAPWNAPKASRNGYDLRADGRGRYRIEKTEDGTWVGEVVFKGGKWHASRRGRTLAFLDVEHSARLALDAFKGVARRSAEEELDDIAERVDRRAAQAGATWLTTAQHCLVGGSENADMTPEVKPRTQEWYALALSGYHTLMDEYSAYEDLVYTTNISDELWEGTL